MTSLKIRNLSKEKIFLYPKWNYKDLDYVGKQG